MLDCGPLRRLPQSPRGGASWQVWRFCAFTPTPLSSRIHAACHEIRVNACKGHYERKHGVDYSDPLDDAIPLDIIIDATLLYWSPKEECGAQNTLRLPRHAFSHRTLVSPDKGDSERFEGLYLHTPVNEAVGVNTKIGASILYRTLKSGL